MSEEQIPQEIEASFSTLVLSIGSSAMLALGLSPNPQTGKVEKDLNMARFNIDLLILLKEKTNNNLSDEESRLLNQIIGDLQNQYVHISEDKQ